MQISNPINLQAAAEVMKVCNLKQFHNSLDDLMKIWFKMLKFHDAYECLISSLKKI